MLTCHMLDSLEGTLDTPKEYTALDLRSSLDRRSQVLEILEAFPSRNTRCDMTLDKFGNSKQPRRNRQLDSQFVN